jgi:long-chain fatty acid transport protein
MSRGILAVAAVGVLQAPAFAGGIERGGYNIDLLFDTSRFAVDSSATFVMPQRKLKNVRDTSGTTPASLNFLGYKSTANDTENYWSPRIGAKAGYEGFDCMFDYSQPYGAHSKPGANWAGAYQNTETKIDSDNYALTCSYKFDVGPGQLRLIGGGNYLEMDGFKERLLIAPELIAASGLDGSGRLDLEGDGWGWRAGVAYEIPEYAFRASLVYYSEVKLNDVSGTVDLTQVPSAVSPLGGLIIPVSGSTAMPDALELKLQSGIAQDWLAFGSVKWTDWSQLQTIPFYNAGGTQITSLDLGYRDGWTITGGIGHKFNDQWSGAVSVTWDRGTSGDYGAQSDTWLFTTGVAYAPTKNVEIRLAGVLGLLTSGDSKSMVVDGQTIGDEATFDYGSDLVAAVSTSLRVKF